ncbi:MAG: hypothetical protein Q3982_07900 [Phoenicibacter congonensis]|uniref:Uncharacterized protein n=1 Tax=Phoenicibacter congonensis TaxID=1944646 RepID=A0AA43UBI1_9ACTN|nr:hypothetical protein [Phoenicibacter congonensis]
MDNDKTEILEEVETAEQENTPDSASEDATEKLEVTAVDNAENADSSEENDDDSKPLPLIPWYKRKNVIGGCIAAICCLAIIGGGAAFFMNQPSAENGSNATAKSQAANNSNSDSDAAASTDARNSKSDSEKQEAQESAKEEVNKTTSTTNSNNTSSSSTSSGSSSSSSPSSSNSSSSGSSTPTHTHTWVTTYHEAQTHEEPVYSRVCVGSHIECLVHGQTIGSDGGCTVATDSYPYHCMANQTRVYDYENQITGYSTVVDSPAWSETYCSSCGASA